MGEFACSMCADCLFSLLLSMSVLCYEWEVERTMQSIAEVAMTTFERSKYVKIECYVTSPLRGKCKSNSTFFARGYSSVVEHSTADREVPGSNPGVP